MICARASINADTGASLFYISFAEAEYFQPCNALAHLNQSANSNKFELVSRVDAQPGKELHLRARDVAVAVRILFEVVLVVFLGGIEVFERADLHEEFFAAAALDLRDALHRLSRAFVGEVNAGLVLAAAVVALPVLHRGVDDIEVGQQRRTAGAFLNLGSTHIGGERLLDELLQRLRLLLFCDGSYDGFTHDIAAAVDHIGGGISKDVGSKLSRLTI